MQTQAGQYTHTPQPPVVASGKHSDQRYFGGRKTEYGQTHAALHMEGESHTTEVTVMRFARDDFADMTVDVRTDDTRQCLTLRRMTASQMEALARALIDAAHDLRTQPSVVLLQQREEVA